MNWIFPTTIKCMRFHISLLNPAHGSIPTSNENVTPLPFLHDPHIFIYEPEVILDSQFTCLWHNKNLMQFLIKWRNSGKSFATWEPTCIIIEDEEEPSTHFTKEPLAHP
eukprot:c18858_g1_i1 orf=189-515(+)